MIEMLQCLGPLWPPPTRDLEGPVANQAVKRPLRGVQERFPLDERRKMSGSIIQEQGSVFSRSPASSALDPDRSSED